MASAFGRSRCCCCRLGGCEGGLIQRVFRGHIRLRRGLPRCWALAAMVMAAEALRRRSCWCRPGRLGPGPAGCLDNRPRPGAGPCGRGSAPVGRDVAEPSGLLLGRLIVTSGCPRSRGRVAVRCCRGKQCCRCSGLRARHRGRPRGFRLLWLRSRRNLSSCLKWRRQRCRDRVTALGAGHRHRRNAAPLAGGRWCRIWAIELLLIFLHRPQRVRRERRFCGFLGGSANEVVERVDIICCVLRWCAFCWRRRNGRGRLVRQWSFDDLWLAPLGFTRSLRHRDRLLLSLRCQGLRGQLTARVGSKNDRRERAPAESTARAISGFRRGPGRSGPGRLGPGPLRSLNLGLGAGAASARSGLGPAHRRWETAAVAGSIQLIEARLGFPCGSSPLLG